MTDNAGLEGPGAPDAPIDTARPATDAASAPPPSATAPASGGKMRPVIIVGALVALIAVILFAVRNNVQAEDLKVGDCFTIPNGTTVKTVEKHPCTESHNAEVFLVGEYTDGTTYPISLSLDRYIDTSCVPAFETYIGRAVDSDPKLSIGYFHPTREGWDSGDRTITCYVGQPDESPTTVSLKKS